MNKIEIKDLYLCFRSGKAESVPDVERKKKAKMKF